MAKLGIGVKVGFTKQAQEYFERWIDPIGNQRVMQKHMDNGYGK